mmetsp:Transcript_17283/g.24969  ORF Transcript_17283/g.24969 Transcript_17283/m.24969 type:complete len:122 (-) Transcript_17283:68-433(-)
MPHLIIEYTPVAKELAPADWKPLFKKLHGIMSEKTGVGISKCKSRAFLLDNYIVGDNEDGQFVHLTVNTVDGGLPQETKRAAGDALKEAMIAFFPGAAEKNIEFSVELRLIPKELYWKHAA